MAELWPGQHQTCTCTGSAIASPCPSLAQAVGEVPEQADSVHFVCCVSGSSSHATGYLQAILALPHLPGAVVRTAPVPQLPMWKTTKRVCRRKSMCASSPTLPLCQCQTLWSWTGSLTDLDGRWGLTSRGMRSCLQPKFDCLLDV